MRKFREYAQWRDRTIIEAVTMMDIKTKVYHAINASIDDDDDTSASPDDVWNQELAIFDDKDEILNDPELADIIRNHPEHGAIVRDIQTGKITVGALIRKLAQQDHDDNRPKPEPSTPSLPAQGPMEPANNPVPVA